MYSPEKDDFIEYWKKTQIPIFRKLKEENSCFSEFRIVSVDQHVGMEKMYAPKERPVFWVYIEIEDAETFEDIECYEIWFQRHENGWLPSNEDEEGEYPIKHAFLTLDGLKNMIESLDRGDFKVLDLGFDEVLDVFESSDE